MRPLRAFRIPSILAALVVASTARAEWWIITPKGYRDIGGGSRCGPYKTRAEAQQVNDQYFDGRRPMEGSDDPAPGSGGGNAGGGGGRASSGDPVFDAMAPVMVEAAGLFGQMLGKALFGDPQEKARREHEEAVRRWNEAREEERRALRRQFESDMAAKESREAAYLREQRHAKITARLKEIGSGVFGDMRDVRPDDDGLRPGGTSFFGIGGGEGAANYVEPAHDDPMVVDLRHVQSGVYIVEMAATAPPQDSVILIDQAFAVATGGSSFVMQGAPDKPPSVNPEGLRAFQEANNRYREERDSNHVLRKKFEEARRRREAASGEERRRLALEEARAKADADAAAWRASTGRAVARRTLVETAVPSPVTYANVLAREREALAPSAADRLAHAAIRPYSDALSDEVDAFIVDSYATVDDPALQARLDGLLARLRAVSPYPDEPRRVRIVGKPLDPSVESGKEGGCFASGHTVYMGIDELKRTPPPTDDELLWVMGHEVTHIHRDHFAKAHLADRYQAARQDAEGLLGADPAPLGEDERAWVRTHARKARLGGYYREQELESDRFGTLLALSAGAKPDAVRKEFARMDKEEEAWESKLPNAAERKRIEITRDHPEPAERFDALRKIYGNALGKPLK